MQWRASIAACRANGPGPISTKHFARGRCLGRWRLQSSRAATCIALITAGHALSPAAGSLQLEAESADVGQIRPVRVLLASNTSRIRIHSGGPVMVSTMAGEPIHAFPALPNAVARAGGERVMQLAERFYPLPGVRLSRVGGEPIQISIEKQGEWSPAADYEGALLIRIEGTDSLSLINEVNLESYVASVVAQEVWPTFHDEALRAQAVVSRTYVLFHMTRRPDAAIDVTATQSSQVYRGVRQDEIGTRAQAAAAYTRGIVLTYPAEDGRERLFCTYYSAACGGSSQPGAAFGPESDVPPLRGGVRCNDCRIAPGDTYRWGPVSIPISDVLSRLASRIPEFGAFHSIDAVVPAEVTTDGRPITLRIVAGESQQTLLAERLRMLLDPAQIRSTHFRVAIDAGRVVFSEGKGFGHGLGLCQWGTQAKAANGQRAGEILSYYFPGAKVVRAY